ncbi:receptor-like serine/threonine-protein kinase ale2 [Anaeramoeba flamelloides]|uniref:Receptor-like serine/threonine-protein kinase ale2 n=1 Tax=Anaeramoeba flamelloides TaxID=1746091 RepID=A0ABQ8YVD0_9EUKA|nr:receptor-like serine/threonine-protein kinase ale2 [Anaeramoeba flamelloides]
MKQKAFLKLITTFLIIFLFQYKPAFGLNEKCLPTYHTPFQSLLVDNLMTGISSSTILTNGNTALVYTKNNSTSSNSINLILTILSENEEKILMKKDITTKSSHIISDPMVVSFNNSRFVVVYENQYYQDSKTFYSIELQFFNGSGELERPELTIFTQGSIIKGLTSSQVNNETIAISWLQLESNQFYTRIYTKLIDCKTYQNITDSIPVSPVEDNCKDPKIVSLDEKNFAIFYTQEIIEEYGSFYSILYQKLSLSGEKIENKCISNYTDSYQGQPSVLKLENGNYLVMWLRTPLDKNHEQNVYRGIVLQILDPSLNLKGNLINVTNLDYNRYDQIPTMVQNRNNSDQLIFLVWVSKWATNFDQDLFQICGKFLTQDGQILNSKQLEISGLSNYTLNSLFVTNDFKILFSQKIDNKTVKQSSIQSTKMHPPTPIVSKVIPNQKFDVNSYFEFTFKNDTFLGPKDYTLNYTSSLSNSKLLPNWIKFDSQHRKFYGNAMNKPIQLTIQVSAENICQLKVFTTFNFDLFEKPTPIPSPTSIPTHCPSHKPTPSTTKSNSENKSSSEIYEIIAISCGISLILIFIFAIIIIRYRNKQRMAKYETLLKPSTGKLYTTNHNLINRSNESSNSLDYSSNSSDNSKDSLDDLISTSTDHF